MPGPEKAVMNRLIAFPTNAADRIYPGRMPQQGIQDLFPLIVYKRISGPRQYTHEGDSLLIEPRIQLSIWAKTYTDVEDTTLQAKAALSGWRDDSVGVQHCFLVFELDEWEEVSGLYRMLFDAQVGYKGAA